MVPEYFATVTAARFGIAQISSGVAVVVDGGSAELILCAQSKNVPKLVGLGTVSDPGAGFYVTEDAPSVQDWSMVQASGGMALQRDGAESRLFLFGASDAMSVSVIGANGDPGAARAVGTSVGPLTKVQTFTVIPDASGDLAALTQAGVSGLRLFEIGANRSFTLTDTVEDTRKSYVSGVSDSASVVVDGQTYLLTISSKESGLTSFAVTDKGEAEMIDSLGNIDLLPVAGPQSLQTVTLGGTCYVILASVNSSSLSVVRVNDMGCLFQTDHVSDDLSTRFRGASGIDVFEVNGRVFVAAGGSDAGLTLFELLPGGQLSQMEVAVFEDARALGNITSIDTVVNGGEVSIYVVEEGGTRLQVYKSDFGALGNLITASGSQTSGTMGGDRILGRDLSDTISGAGGDDFVHDGKGADRLSGGNGDDVFVICADTSTDQITDFENGDDLIDLSDWGRIYTASVLSMRAVSGGVEISYGANTLLVTPASGESLRISGLSDADFLF